MQSTSQSTSSVNKQGIFDRQLEMCATFVNLNINALRFFDYKVDNNGIEISVLYNKNSDWGCDIGRTQVIDLVKHYKLHLLGYELHKIRFIKSSVSGKRFKQECKYVIPLNLLKFNNYIFYYNEDYLTYTKFDKVKYFRMFNV